MTALPTHPFGIVGRHEQVRSWLPSTSPFFALGRVQASTSRANERRRIHSTFPAIFGPFLPANTAVRAGGWECKTYVCISCQTYTPPFLHHQAWQETAQVYTSQDHSRLGHLPTMADHLFGPAFRSLGDVTIVSVSRSLALFFGLAG